jgi:hypothetical protein
MRRASHEELGLPRAGTGDHQLGPIGLGDDLIPLIWADATLDTHSRSTIGDTSGGGPQVARIVHDDESDPGGGEDCQRRPDRVILVRLWLRCPGGFGANIPS